ncbi:hypothetical protein D5086_005397 [Populus alba]|uniref:Uncharacterized protein n=1 Tax=Populus alba TaxID=43335 RepID=A0ACC4CUQ0_POPAL
MNWVQRKIYLYNVTFGLFMLDWWERCLFNRIQVCESLNFGRYSGDRLDVVHLLQWIADQMMHHSGLGPAPLEAFVKVPKFLRVLILKFIVQVDAWLCNSKWPSLQSIWIQKLISGIWTAMAI